MAKIQKFRQFINNKTFFQGKEVFGSKDWFGPLEIIDVDGDIINTNYGELINKSGSKLTKGYSYILKLSDNNIIETGMSCVDLIILTDNLMSNGDINPKYKFKVLSIKRGHDPFAGMWANPGGNIDEGEKPIDAAIRELEEETGLKLKPTDFRFIGKFDEPWRDPRNKNCVTYAFQAFLDEDQMVNVTPGDDAVECAWNEVSLDGDMKVDMAFDHLDIIKTTVEEYKY